MVYKTSGPFPCPSPGLCDIYEVLQILEERNAEIPSGSSSQDLSFKNPLKKK